MKKSLLWTFIILVVVALACGGCQAQNTSDNKDSFAFELPSGFTISEVSDKECSIIDETGAHIGGIALTDLKLKDIKDADGIALPQYLNKIHEGSEYVSWNGDNSKNPTKYVSQFISQPDSAENKELYRVFFERNSLVYDMWFDTDMIDGDEIKEIVSCVVEK